MFGISPSPRMVMASFAPSVASLRYFKFMTFVNLVIEFIHIRGTIPNFCPTTFSNFVGAPPLCFLDYLSSKARSTNRI
jgi:hypothetical protein